MLVDGRAQTVRPELVSDAVGNSYIERPPPAGLADVVASMWLQQIGRDADPYIHRNLPNGSVELRCRVGYLPQVGGPLTRAEVEVLAPGTTIGHRWTAWRSPPNCPGRFRRARW
jgi:hypothetical protein